MHHRRHVGGLSYLHLTRTLLRVVVRSGQRHLVVGGHECLLLHWVVNMLWKARLGDRRDWRGHRLEGEGDAGRLLRRRWWWIRKLDRIEAWVHRRWWDGSPQRLGDAGEEVVDGQQLSRTERRARLIGIKAHDILLRRTLEGLVAKRFAGVLLCGASVAPDPFTGQASPALLGALHIMMPLEGVRTCAVKVAVRSPTRKASLSPLASGALLILSVAAG